MAEIIIAGHKNPDTDSVCSAYCYAVLKNKIDPDSTYIPVICGTVQPQARFVFNLAEITPPAHIKDIRPVVVDVARRDSICLDESDPVLSAASLLDQQTISVIPVLSKEGTFKGMVGLHEISQYFVSGGMQERPVYAFSEENIGKVVSGCFLKKGKAKEFTSRLMIGAMEYESSVKRINNLLPDKPLLVVGMRERIIRYAVENDFPAIVLTGTEGDNIDFDFTGYNGMVYLSELDTAETIRMLRLSVPVRHIMDTDPPSFAHDELFDSAKKTILSSEYRGLPVFKDGEYAGVVTRRSFIEKPRKKIILVDHNELSQSLLGAEDAEICEIIDHHRLAAEKTNSPIYVYAKPVGSTCTIVFEHFKMHDEKADAKTALLLLAGIMSDTLGLRSPTTTKQDIVSAQQLSVIAGVPVEEFSKTLLAQMPLLKDVDADQSASADFKEYNEKNISAGIGQIEVASLDGINEEKGRFLSALEKIKKERTLNWAMLLITNVSEENSVLVATSMEKAEKEISYKKISDNLFDLPGIVSRKKQLLPEILRVIDSLNG